jgi:hypothetical protein
MKFAGYPSISLGIHGVVAAALPMSIKDRKGSHQRPFHFYGFLTSSAAAGVQWHQLTAIRIINNNNNISDQCNLITSSKMEYYATQFEILKSYTTQSHSL